MRRSAIIVMMCAMLVAALLSPGLAMAKGGNGRHQVATSKASDTGKAEGAQGKAGKSKAKKAAAKKAKSSKHSGKTAEPKAASSSQRTTAKSAEKPAHDARTTDAVEEQQSTAAEQPTGARTSTKATPGSPPSTDLADGRISADTMATEGIETRGVLDTIRLKVNASLESTRATAVEMWSTVTSWFGN